MTVAVHGRDAEPPVTNEPPWLGRARSGGDSHCAVIVAVAFARVMQVAIHEVVGVVAVRHRFVSAARAVGV